MGDVKKVPPDGGYGWIIMLAMGVNYFVTIPVMQGFGLIFKDTFEDLNFTATEISMILNTCAAFSMLIGIINGPLLKQFGFRKVSSVGAAFVTAGVLLTSRATEFKHFLISHGFITSFGMGIGMSAYSLALNSYFTTKRGKATGLGMTIAGLGPIIMPQLMSLLLFVYGVQGAVVILGGIVAHSFVSAILLQPVKWHMKEQVVSEEASKLAAKNEENGVRNSSDDLEAETMLTFDPTSAGSMWSLNEEKRRKASVSSKKGMSKSLEVLNKAHEENGASKEDVEEKRPLQPVNEKEDEKLGQKHEKQNKQSLFKIIISNIVDMFDLTLLKDPIYLNIMFGMSLAIFAEMNFSVLTPFILGDYNLTVPQIATFMSIVSILDIIFRFCAPFVGDLLKQSHRVMYLISMILLIITRFLLLLTSEYNMLLVIAATLGVAKGFRTVYYALVIPSYVPIERFAAAAGIQMTVNGIFVLIGGPVIGFIRDISGNYRNCIYVINGVTFMTFVMWTTEILYVKYKRKNKKSTEADIEKT